MRTFEWNGAKITVTRPNGFSRVRQWQYGQTLLSHEDIPADVKAAANTMLHYLANTKQVDGDLGFPVPIDNPTADDLIAFIQGLGEADETLTLLWDTEIYEARHATNDPDLLPPDAVPKKSSKAKASKKNGDSSD